MGFPGSRHDAGVMHECGVEQLIDQLHPNLHVLGDAGFGIRLNLITPFRDDNSIEKKIFNQTLSSVRVVIENAFALLKGRFKCLQLLRFDIHKIPSIVLCCCLLHNFFISMKDIDVDLQDVVYEKFTSLLSNISENQKQQAEQKRLQIMNIVNS